MSQTKTQEVAEAPALTSKDRCDRCGAQSYVRIQFLPSRDELLYCAHHSRAKAEQMSRLYMLVFDQGGFRKDVNFMRTLRLPAEEKPVYIDD